MIVVKAPSQSSLPMLPDLTETEVASMRVAEGATVVRHDGRYWWAPFRGFFEPVHLIRRFSIRQVERPTRLCWGFLAALSDDDAHLATGSIPIHQLTDLEHFTESALGRNRRADLRKCMRQVELIQVQDASLLLEQGYDVSDSARKRTCQPPMAEAVYRDRVSKRAGHHRRLIIAGLVDGRLGGYLEAYAVGSTLYLDKICAATEALPTGISTGLFVAAIEAGLRAGTLHQVVNGLHMPEKPGLCAFKDSLGFRVVQVPARIVMPALVEAYPKARRPGTHYRLVGVKQPRGTGLWPSARGETS